MHKFLKIHSYHFLAFCCFLIFSPSSALRSIERLCASLSNDFTVKLSKNKMHTMIRKMTKFKGVSYLKFILYSYRLTGVSSMAWITQSLEQQYLRSRVSHPQYFVLAQSWFRYGNMVLVNHRKKVKINTVLLIHGEKLKFHRKFVKDCIFSPRIQPKHFVLFSCVNVNWRGSPPEYTYPLSPWKSDACLGIKFSRSLKPKARLQSNLSQSVCQCQHMKRCELYWPFFTSMKEISNVNIIDCKND